MTTIYGMLRFPKEILESSIHSDNQCEYHFKNTEWEYSHTTSARIEEWSCPYEPTNGSNYCIFHESIEEKQMSQVYNKIKEITQEYPNLGLYPFIGGEFKNIELDRLPTDDLDEYSVLDFRNCNIYGKISSPGATVNCGLDFCGSEIYNGIRIADTQITGRFDADGSLLLKYKDETSVALDNVEFDGAFSWGDVVSHIPIHFHDCEFQEEANIRDGIFCDRFTLQRTLCKERVNLQNCKFLFEPEEGVSSSFFGSTFHRPISLHGCVFRGPQDWGEATVNETCLFVRADINGDISLRYTTIKGRMDFSNSTMPSKIHIDESEIGYVDLRGTSPQAKESNFQFVESVIEKGRLFQPPDGKFLFEFWGGKVGDIDFRPDKNIPLVHPTPTSLWELMIQSESGLDKVRFFKTTFEGFQFGNYELDFERIGYEIHKLEGKEIKEKEFQLKIGRQEELMAREFKGEVMEPAALVGTYSSAKNGASEVGAHQTSSEFFIKEMKYKKQQYRNEFISDILSGNILNHPKFSVNQGIRWQINSFLELISGYGERLWVPIVYSILTIINFSLLYPLIGGVSDGREIYSMSNYPEIGIEAILYHSFYYSIATFTTLGTGDVHPEGTASEIVSSIEALAGTFLVALLIFMLGRKVIR